MHARLSMVQNQLFGYTAKVLSYKYELKKDLEMILGLDLSGRVFGEITYNPTVVRDNPGEKEFQDTWEDIKAEMYNNATKKAGDIMK